MTIDDICRSLESHKQWLSRNTKHPEDVFQDGVVALLTQGESEIKRLHKQGKLHAWFHVTLKNIIINQHNKLSVEVVYTDQLDHIPSHEYNLPKTEKEIKDKLIKSVKGYWYDKAIFYLYLEKESVRGVARKTGIPFQSLAATIKKCKEDILNDYITTKVG